MNRSRDVSTRVLVRAVRAAEKNTVFDAVPLDMAVFPDCKSGVVFLIAHRNVKAGELLEIDLV